MRNMEDARKGLKMNSEQVQQLEAEIQKVHNLLANALVSLHFISNNPETSSPERRLALEMEWQRILTQAISDLSAALHKARLQ